MPKFELLNLLKWVHFVFLVGAGGGAVSALLISGLEDEREDLRGLAAALWGRQVRWAFRVAFAAGIILLVVKFQEGARPFDAYYLHIKLFLAVLGLAFVEVAPKALAVAKRGAAMFALLLFLLAAFTAMNKGAFGRRTTPVAGAVPGIALQR